MILIKNVIILGHQSVSILNYDEHNETITHKAGLIAKGFNKFRGGGGIYDVRCFMQLRSFWLSDLTIFECLLKLKCTNYRIDINNAYLHATLNEVIYMKQQDS